MIKKVYKAHILYTKEQSRFEVLENGYVAVDTNGRVTGVAPSLASLGAEEAEVIDFGNCLLIPAMNDLHVHAPQRYRLCRTDVPPLCPRPMALRHHEGLRLRHNPHRQHPPANATLPRGWHGSTCGQGRHEPQLPGRAR